MHLIKSLEIRISFPCLDRQVKAVAHKTELTSGGNCEILMFLSCSPNIGIWAAISNLEHKRTERQSVSPKMLLIILISLENNMTCVYFSLSTPLIALLDFHRCSSQSLRHCKALQLMTLFIHHLSNFQRFVARILFLIVNIFFHQDYSPSSSSFSPLHDYRQSLTVFPHHRNCCGSVNQSFSPSTAFNSQSSVSVMAKW